MFGNKEKVPERFVCKTIEGSSLNESGKHIVLVDRETGVNYLYIRTDGGYSAGLTVLYGPDGKPLITDVPIAE
ncbi:MAG: DUF6440 family protein [Oscillospiraceae bacterium]|nr:DUF6440 family protein [Oscillospiraceae bacterium]